MVWVASEGQSRGSLGPLEALEAWEGPRKDPKTTQKALDALAPDGGVCVSSSAPTGVCLDLDD